MVFSGRYLTIAAFMPTVSCHLEAAAPNHLAFLHSNDHACHQGMIACCYGMIRSRQCFMSIDGAGYTRPWQPAGRADRCSPTTVYPAYTLATSTKLS